MFFIGRQGYYQFHYTPYDKHWFFHDNNKGTKEADCENKYSDMDSRVLMISLHWD